ncbi:MAG: SDR family oxidoreductase, partial [Alphaproteobacteria bacterium]
MGRLDGKIALIVGAAGKDNMGQVIARRFVKEGARVMVAGRKRDALATFAKEIDGGYTVGDFSKKGDIDRMVAETVDSMGGIDIA